MAKGSKLKLLNLMRPAMALLPEVEQPDNKVNFYFVYDLESNFV